MRIVECVGRAPQLVVLRPVNSYGAPHRAGRSGRSRYALDNNERWINRHARSPETDAAQIRASPQASTAAVGYSFTRGCVASVAAPPLSVGTSTAVSDALVVGENGQVAVVKQPLAVLWVTESSLADSLCGRPYTSINLSHHVQSGTRLNAPRSIHWSAEKVVPARFASPGWTEAGTP